MPVINPAGFASGYGFMSDYLAEMLAELRRRNFLTHVSAQISFRGVTPRGAASAASWSNRWRLGR
jgi:hypothetical protein